MTHGNKPTDDGNFILNEKEAAAFCKKYPNHAHLLHRYIGGKDFLHGKPVRFCLWLKDILITWYCQKFPLNDANIFPLDFNIERAYGVDANCCWTP